MALNLTIPQINQKATTKDYVISLLSHDWPLTAKKLYNLMKKRYSHNVTYQAVYKVLQELLKQEIIKKTEQGYEINLYWLKEVHSFTEIVETNYYTKNRLRLIEGVKDARKEGNINILTFETLFDVEKYLYYLQKNYIQGSNKKEAICVHHNYEWRPLFYLRAEYNWIRKISDKGCRTYILCANNTAIDQWSASFYKSLGCKVKTKVNCASTCELMVFGNFVIQVYIPSLLKSSFDKYFIKIKKIEDINYNKLVEDIFEKKTEIQVVINKDKNIAEQIKEETLRNFS